MKKIYILLLISTYPIPNFHLGNVFRRFLPWKFVTLSPIFTVTSGLNLSVIQLYAILELTPFVTVKIGDAV